MKNSMHLIGVILLGGRSSRMGQPKALLPYKNKPFVQYAIDVLRHVNIDQLILSGQLEGYETYADATPFKGPVAAMISLIRAAPASSFLFLPVDTPLLQQRHLHQLIRGQRSAYFAHKYLPCFIVPNENAVSSEEASVSRWLADQRAEPLPLAPHEEVFFKNINTPLAYEELVHEH